MLKEFRDFAMKGNVIDLAVGVIIGGAFGKIVSSLVSDIIMPLLGLILGGVNFIGLSVTIGSSIIKYGQFIQNVVDFVIIAFSIFIVVKGLTKLQKSKKETPKPEPKPSKEELLLTEIRDLLKNK